MRQFVGRASLLRVEIQSPDQALVLRRKLWGRMTVDRQKLVEDFLPISNLWRFIIVPLIVRIRCVMG
jgi:hypothetical protein